MIEKTTPEAAGLPLLNLQLLVYRKLLLLADRELSVLLESPETPADYGFATKILETMVKLTAEVGFEHFGQEQPEAPAGEEQFNEALGRIYGPEADENQAATAPEEEGESAP